MLATYNEAEFVAVYHHCRSILSELPFSGGLENLAQLIVKNSEIVRHLKPHSKYATLKGKANVEMETQAFLLRFVHVHGKLFNLSTRAHQSYGHLIDSQSQSQSQSQYHLIWSNMSIPPHSLEASSGESESELFLSVLRPVLEEFDDLLSAGALPDVMLVRLIVISIFSVHYAVGRDANLLCWSGMTISTEEGMNEYLKLHSNSPRTISESLALHALFGLINKYVF